MVRLSYYLYFQTRHTTRRRCCGCCFDSWNRCHTMLRRRTSTRRRRSTTTTTVVKALRTEFVEFRIILLLLVVVVVVPITHLLRQQSLPFPQNIIVDNHSQDHRQHSRSSSAISVMAFWMTTTTTASSSFRRRRRRSSITGTAWMTDQPLLSIMASLLQQRRRDVGRLYTKGMTSEKYNDKYVDTTATSTVTTQQDPFPPAPDQIGGVGGQHQQQQEEQFNGLLMELQHCTTIHDVLDRVGVPLLLIVSSAGHDSSTTTTSSSTTTVAAMKVSSLILIRLSKLFMYWNNQQIHHQQQKEEEGSTAITITATRLHPVMNTTALVLLRDIISHFLQQSTDVILAMMIRPSLQVDATTDNGTFHSFNSNRSSSVSMTLAMMDAIVDGTKACAVLSRLMMLIPLVNDDDPSNSSSRTKSKKKDGGDNDCENYNVQWDATTTTTHDMITKPLVDFYTRYGSLLVPYLQAHHLSGIQWALDCCLLQQVVVPLSSKNSSTSSSRSTTSTPARNLQLVFPPSIQTAYRAMKIPFYIIPQCLTMIDVHGDYITVNRIIQEVEFRTDEISTSSSSSIFAAASGTGTNSSADSSNNVVTTERRLTAWQGDSNVAPFAYSGKTMERNDWSPIIVYIRDQLYNRTGQYYDGCLLNLYHHGKSGMRYHSDPDQGVLWDTDTAVVSIGASRRFTFRSIIQQSSAKTKRKNTPTDRRQRQRQRQPQLSEQQEHPHSFVVMDSDVTYMFNDCQQLYQHSVKNAENKNETTSRISLVFKRTLSIL